VISPPDENRSPEPGSGRARLRPSRPPLGHDPARQEPRPTGDTASEPGCQAKDAPQIPRLELRQVTKRFGARLAVDRLDLAVPAGEIFGLLGHNGAGKSTAIGMLLGQVWPTSGEVHVCGLDVHRQRGEALRRVGAIFETPAFYEYLSGWRNLEIYCQYTGPMCRRHARDVVEWVGLTGRIHSRVRTYSHGMRARLALAQALLPGPELLILDEPADGLDPEGMHELRQTLLRLHDEFGLTLLLSSHLLGEVEQLCTRIAVLKEGRKVFDGPLAAVKQARDGVRLVTDNFAAATASLERAGLITRCLGTQDRAPMGHPVRQPMPEEARGRQSPIPQAAQGTSTPEDHEPETLRTWPAAFRVFDDQRSGVIMLAPGRQVHEVVEHLVGARHPVHEITPEERTLERFYLELMR